VRDEAFAARLRWEPGHGGCARRKGRTVPLEHAPDLGAGPVYSVDYIPRVLALVVPTVTDGHPRDMLPAEIAAAEALLRDAVPTVPGAL